MLDSVTELIGATLRTGSPLVFAALGGMLSERSGVVNICLEGFMLSGAFAAGVVASYTQNPWLAALAGMVAGALFAVIYAWVVIRWKANQIVAGTAINLLVAGLAPVIGKVLFNNTSQTPALPLDSRFVYAPIVLAWSLPVLLWAVDRYLPVGAWIRVAGEKPQALETTGISVRKVRWSAVVLSGVLAGLGGVTLSVCLSSVFTRGISGGRGFVALAALILGKWKPIPAALACLFFGLTEAAQFRLQAMGGENIPVQFFQILPNVVTLLVVAGFVGKSRAPAQIGTPY